MKLTQRSPGQKTESLIFARLSLLGDILMRVLQIQRKPLTTQFSVEGYFQRVRECFASEERPDVMLVPCYSRGIIPRLRNCLAVFRSRARIWHVTGDIHYVCCVLPKQSTVLTVLDCQVLSRLKGWRRAILKYFWYTLPARCVSRITVISEETKRELLTEIDFPADRIHVIPVSVSPLFQPSVKLFDAKHVRVLQVGTKANKNVDRLAQALSGLSVHLEIVGPVNPALKTLLEDCRVSHTVSGRLTDEELAERYRQADIIAFVSTHEGFGMPIVEAQCVERVCVTSNCSSMPEVAGSGACLVDPYSVQSIREGFVRVISDERYRQDLIAEGRLNRQRFAAKKIAEQFREVYRLVELESSADL